MKSLHALLLIALATSAQAADTTAPTLDIQHTWVEKTGGKTYFKMLLDPVDDTGFTPNAAIQFRSKLNSLAVLPDNTPWNTYPWVRGTPFEVTYNCTSVIFEVRAIDAAGNVSPLQRRTYASPFPLSTAPNLDPKLVSALPFTGPAIDCRGLFSMDFDGEGVGDDIMQIDRTTGLVKVRRQGTGGAFTSNGFQLTANSINDSAVADFNGDDRPDLAVVVDDTLKVFMNAGVVSGILQFTETPPAGLGTTGITTVLYCAVGDITGEGKPDIVISGTSDDGMGGTRTRIAWLLNNDQFQLSASNHALPSDTTGAGRLGVGDVSGDGWADVVMADTENSELVLFYNRANGSLAGDDDVNTDLRPDRVPTGYSLGGLPAESLVVGDVTGDGRADAVITAHYFGATAAGGDGPTDTRDHQFWQLFEGRPPQAPNGLSANNLYLVGPKGPVAAASTPFKSHVILQDLTGDRFPEIVLTSQFQPGTTGQPAGGVEAVRVTARLNEVNLMTHLNFTQSAFGTGVGNPHRLAVGRFGINEKRDILVANGGNPQLHWVFNVYTPTTKPTDLQGGAYTSADLGGTAGPNGVYSYYGYAGSDIYYTVTYSNNTATDLTNVVIESALPAEFELVSSDVGGVVSGTGASRVIRWTETVEAYSAGVKNFRVTLAATVKANASIAPKLSLKQGTKILMASSLPLVKVAAPNFTVVPNSPGQPWSFTFKPFVIPAGILVTGLLQTSVNGTTWTSIPMGIMTLANGVYSRTETNVPGTARYFRAALFSEAGYKYSSVFNNFLPPTTALGLSSKSPPKSGQLWTFSATQPSTAANVSVRFQSSSTPEIEMSWSDLPIYTSTIRSGNIWTSKTYNIPTGAMHFRAISSAPGWVDSISASSGPWNVIPSSLSLPPFSFFHIDFADPARSGNPVTFYATCPLVSGLKVRFQSKLSSEDDSAWSDLTKGTLTQSGTKWTFKTNAMPYGDRDFRAISSAPAYNDNFSQVYSFEVLPPPPPQVGTYFGPFITPETGDFVKAGIVPVSLTAVDVNGIQKVTLEYAAGTAAFKPVSGVTLQLVGGTITYTGDVNFTGSGTLRLRAVVVDGHEVSQTTYSSECTITVGQGGGSQPPYFTSATPLLTPSTAKSRGSVKMKIKIGDDKEVREAFLHRTDVNGVYQGTVGQMIPVAKTNPAEFSCSDLNLPDGLYYYRVVAQDFDGQEGISSTYGPYVLSTPQPPPAEVNIYMDVSSRFVGPTVPKEKYNYPYMPYPAASSVTFNYSFNSPPGGTVTFHAYKIQEANGAATQNNRNQSIWTGTTTTATGSKNFPAPFWTKDKKNPNAGEGTYRIVASVNGTQLGQGSGIREFTVGHAWNLPNTFTELDYGLYWFKNINDGLRCRDNQDDEYFDRSKPTVIYVHGWQPEEAGKRRRESWARQDAVTDSKFYDCCTIWKTKGYNVGVFNWNVFNDFKWGGQPDDGVIFSQYAIYNIYTQPGLPAGHSLLYTLNRTQGTKAPDFAGTSQSFYLPHGEGGAIEGKTVVDLFLDELRRCMAGYTTNGDDKEFRLVGHSLGTQVVGRTAKLILDYPQWQIPRPTRIALLEIAQIKRDDLDVPGFQKQWLSDLIGAGVALECYQSTDLQSLNGILNGVSISEIHDMAAYAKIVPDHIPWNVNLEKRNSQTHGDVVRWYMSSMGEPERPAYGYRIYVGGQFHNFLSVGGAAISANSPGWWIRALMGNPNWFEQRDGRDTLTVSDDTFGIWDDRNQ